MLLAQLLRPQTLEDFSGQSHLLGVDKPLRVAIEKGLVFSIIFWGPPGVGKTTLSRLIAKYQKRDFIELSAVSAGKSDIRKIIQDIDALGPLHKKEAPILFLDEIHRFNKAQQDYLLPFVEEGKIILIGATTENPSFEVISALLSRTKVFTLQPLSGEEIENILNVALVYFDKTYKKKIKINKEAKE